VLGSLANERTHLAWQRTAMSWAGAGAAVIRVFAEDGVLRLRTATGALMVLVGALVWVDGQRRYRAADAAIRAGGAAARARALDPGGVAGDVLAVAVTVVAEVAS
jgi:uncharacterized membrane protein YidH (DUF202 family)